MKTKLLFNRLIVVLSVLLFIFCSTTNALGQNTVYFFSDFEADDGGLIGSGSWQWGLVRSGPDTAYSDFLCWATNLEGPYSASANETLDTPVIDLTQASSAQLTFWHWYEFESDGSTILDGGQVKIAAEGDTFKLLTPLRDYDGLLNNENNLLNQNPVFGGLFAGKQWKMTRFNLQKYVGKNIIIRFEMASDATVNYAGWYIDNLVITENLPLDAAIWSIDAPLGEVDFFLPPFYPKVSVYNAGSDVASFDVQTKIFSNGLEVYHSMRSVIDLMSDDLIPIEFDPWTPSQSGDFQLETYLVLPTDGDRTNDTLRANITVVANQFSDVATIAGLDSLFQFYATWGDYNGDGFMDIHAAQETLITNLGNGSFQPDIVLPETWNYNPSWNDEYYVPGIWGDFDNDGDQDLFVPRLWDSTPSLSGNLLRNEGTGFVDVTSQAGFVTPNTGDEMDIQNAAWLDYDNDGYLDLYIGINHSPNQLYHNEGDGAFTEVGETAGVGLVHARSMEIFDYDNDGFVDLFLYCSFFDPDSGVFIDHDVLLHNEGNGVFIERTEEAGVSGTRLRDATIGDFNNDGFLDLFVIRSGSEDGLYLNIGDGKFAALERPGNIPVGALGGIAAVDYDNDGYLDLLANVPAYMSESGLIIYHNDNGTGEFSAVLIPKGRKFIDQQGLQISVDYDNDGDVDIFTIGREFLEFGDFKDYPFLFRNNENTHNWLAVRLNGTVSNRSGIGAHVWLIAGGKLQTREISGGTAMHSPKVPVAYFGLGNVPFVDTLKVRWPSGQIDIITNFYPNKYITIQEGTGIISSINSEAKINSPQGYALLGNYPNPFNPETTIMYQLPEKSAVSINIYNLNGQIVRSLFNGQKPSGDHKLTWDGKDDFGHNVASGIYLLRFSAGNFIASQKLTLVR